ncbi:hypothetical protein ACP70R_007302 [Stipagrostis hirtigluma subsp. patula]
MLMRWCGEDDVLLQVRPTSILYGADWGCIPRRNGGVAPPPADEPEEANKKRAGGLHLHQGDGPRASASRADGRRGQRPRRTAQAATASARSKRGDAAAAMVVWFAHRLLRRVRRTRCGGLHRRRRLPRRRARPRPPGAQGGGRPGVGGAQRARGAG